jgi:hypothetical protein
MIWCFEVKRIDDIDRNRFGIEWRFVERNVMNFQEGPDSRDIATDFQISEVITYPGLLLICGYPRPQAQ